MKLTKKVNKNLKFCNLQVLFKTNKLKNYFRYKDLVPKPYVLITVIIFRAEVAQFLI